MNVLVLLALIAGMVAIKLVVTRFVPVNDLAWAAIWWIAIYLALVFGIDPPMPSSIVLLFMVIVTLALLAYLSADEERLRVVTSRIVHFVVEKKYTVPLVIVVVVLPLLVAFKVYLDMSKPPQLPVSSRTIHPPPPGEITFQGKTIDLARGDNPYRALESSDPDAFERHVDNGRRVYFENCFYCHGDNMQGRGMYTHGFDPIPANFQDPTTIAMLQETYLFWRIAKGAPGLPKESTPWASAMPAWELFLTEEEIWDVILFLYEYTDQEPRAQEIVE
ncbi:MAG: c-type cytochrome [Rhodothermales bacterium]